MPKIEDEIDWGEPTEVKKLDAQAYRLSLKNLVYSPKTGRPKFKKPTELKPKRKVQPLLENTSLKTPYEKVLGYPVVTHTMVLKKIFTQRSEIPTEYSRRQREEFSEHGTVNHKALERARGWYSEQADVRSVRMSIIQMKNTQEFLSKTNQFGYNVLERDGIRLDPSVELENVMRVFISSLELYPQRFVTTEVATAIPIQDKMGKLQGYYLKVSDFLVQSPKRVPFKTLDVESDLVKNADKGGADIKFTAKRYGKGYQLCDFFGMQTGVSILWNDGVEQEAGFGKSVIVPHLWDKRTLGNLKMRLGRHEIYSHIYTDGYVTSNELKYDDYTASRGEEKFLNICRKILNID